MPRFRPVWTARAAALVAAAVAIPAVQAQTAPVRVAVVCQQTSCDTDFLRTELGYVSFVREQGDADVQAFVTSDANGAGGRTYSVRLVGTGRFAGRTDTYRVPLRADATDDASRRALARTLAAGLMPYLAQSGGLDAVTIAARTGLAPATAAPAAPERDPWNRWVFSTTVASTFNGDQNRLSLQSRAYGSASRVTDAWKTNVSFYGNRDLSRFRLASGKISRNEQRAISASASVARSLDARTTVGGTLSAETSRFLNKELGASATVGVERSLFPYAQSTSRLVTARYNVGVAGVAYRDTTVFNRTDEVMPMHSARLAVDLRQPWGTVGLYTLASQYLAHLDQYSLTQAVSFDVRIARGLSVGSYGAYSRTRNQRHIARVKNTDEDVLLQRRALLSGYNFFGAVGMRYTFGSARAGAVNNRFKDGYSLSFSY